MPSVFEAWYKTQTKYRTKADRERDVELEAASMTMSEMVRSLLISRKEVYNILLTGRDKDQFYFVYIADRCRVTKESFERWYAGQSRYHKLCDRSPKEIAAIERKQQEAVKPRLKVDSDRRT